MPLVHERPMPEGQLEGGMAVRRKPMRCPRCGQFCDADYGGAAHDCPNDPFPRCDICGKPLVNNHICGKTPDYEDR